MTEIFSAGEVGKYSADAMLELFVNRLVSAEEEYTKKWMEVTGFCLAPEGVLTAEFYHMMVTAYFEGIFEVVRHDMNREDAKKCVAMMGKYHRGGFLAIVEGKTTEIR